MGGKRDKKFRYVMGHSMSNQHKKILTPTDLNENWLLHSVS